MKSPQEAPPDNREDADAPQNDEEAVVVPPADIAEEKKAILRSRQSPFYSLSFRNYRLFFIGQSVSVAGTWMQTVAQNWLVWELTHSGRWLGIVNGAGAIPFVVFSLWGGQVADRYSRRDILMVTQAAAMVMAFGMAFLASNLWIPVQAWHIAVVAAFSSVINAFNMPAQQAAVTDMVDEREALSNAIALNSLRFNLARFLGPIIGGYVLVKVNASACFLVNGLSYIATLISLLLMRLPPAVAHEHKLSVWEGFRYIKENRTVFRIVLLIGLTAMTAWPVSTLFPVFATHFHVGARGYSTIMAMNGIGAALGGLALAVFGSSVPRRTLVYGGAFGFCGALLLFSLASNYYVALACLTLSGFAMITLGISCNTYVQETVPDALRGRVMAVYSLVFNGLFPVGGLQIGYMAERLGEIAAVRLNATLSLLVAATLLLWSQTERKRQER